MIRIFVVLLSVAILAGSARSSSTLGAVLLDEALVKAADEIQRRLEARPADQRSVALSSFTCPTDLRATGGAMLAKKLTDELKKRKITLVTRPAFSIVGEYRDLPGTDPGTVEKASISIAVADRTGKSLGDPIVTTVEGIETLTLLFPGLVPPGKTGLALDHKMALKKTRVMANEASKYAIEVLAVDNPTPKTKSSEYKLLDPRLDEGLARVDLRRGQAYAIRVYNNSDADAAVEVMIDGVSMFDFASERDLDGRPRIKFVYLRKGANTLVRGWHLTDTRTDLFYVTDKDKSAGYHKMMLRDLGTITVRFHACWEKASDRPRGEPDFTDRNLGTGFGLHEVPEETKRVKLSVGVIRESVPVMYTRP